MSVLRNSRKTRITRNYASGIKRRDSQANRAAFARHIERKRKAFFSCHCEARSAAAIPQIKYVILSAAKYPTTKVESICPVSSSVGSFTPFRMTYKKLSHIERKRNIPQNYRSTRCHCEARSAAAIPLKKNGKYAPQTFTLPGDCFATLAKTNFASSFGVNSPAETGEMSR